MAQVIGAYEHFLRKAVEVDVLGVMRVDKAYRFCEMLARILLAAALIHHVEKIVQNFHRTAAQIGKIRIVQQKFGILFDDIRQRGKGSARLDGAAR